VARLVGTRVEVGVVLGQQVDVVEEVAVVVSASPARLREANVQQHAAVETARRRLSPTNNAVIQLLFLSLYVSK